MTLAGVPQVFISTKALIIVAAVMVVILYALSRIDRDGSEKVKRNATLVVGTIFILAFVAFMLWAAAHGAQHG